MRLSFNRIQRLTVQFFIMPTKINIILCDTFPGLLPEWIPSYVSMFTRMFDAAAAGRKLSYKVYEAMNGELPSGFSMDELYLITGCNLSVYDDIGWVNDLLGWIAKADRAKAKLTGICFGHQAVAEALGGKVLRSEKGWGIGVRESVIIDPTVRRYFPHKTLRLLYNHHDQVVRLPEGAVVVAESEFCPYESMRIGSHILTFQGHPEYVPQYEEHLIRNFADGEPESVKAAALDSLSRMDHQELSVAEWILRWCDER